MCMFSNSFYGKKVIVTGHTGFKGTWLTAWLLKLGAEVTGISIDIPTTPSMFEELNLGQKIKDLRIDVRDLDKLSMVINETSPDFVFHLAAQPIVSTSYTDPVYTFTTNVIGTVNVLQALRSVQHKCVAIIITSDKCYDNVEWVWGYKENDQMGGKDIYSGSKGAAELVFKSFFHSFFKDKSNVRIASARAGNVIGGGDWAKDRIVPDAIRSWIQKKPVELRSPTATRPWQHVLEPLSGYLNLAQQLYLNDKLNGESFNFGPNSENNHTVLQLIQDMAKHWNLTNEELAYRITDNIPFHEAGLLKLNCDKALFYLKWKPTLTYDKLIEFTGKWYYEYFNREASIWKFTINQLNEYEQIAQENKVAWTY